MESLNSIDRKAAARRKQRAAEAKRRLRATPADSPPTQSEEADLPGIFGIWRSSQHFCDTRSIPDAVAHDLKIILRWADQISAYPARQRLIARQSASGAWQPVCYSVKGQRQEITVDQAEKYERCQLGLIPWSNDKYEPLKPGDHPASTRHL